MESLKNLLFPKTFNRFSYVANVFWIFLQGILFGIFLDIEINESRLDFVCGSNDDSEELIRWRCWEQYEKKTNKFGIPMYGFLIVNFCVTASVLAIYSQAVKSRVDGLEGRTNIRVSQADSTQPRITLFNAYIGQLVVRILLGIFFVLIQALLLYPRSFPSIFYCNLANEGNFTASSNVKQIQTSYECNDRRAGNKTFWGYAVIVVTGTFTLFVLVEMLYILILLPRKVEEYMDDPQFHKYYLTSKSNPPKPRTPDQEQPFTPLIGSEKDEPDNEPTNSSRQRPFRPTRSQSFLTRLSTAEKEVEFMAVSNVNSQHDVARFTIQNLNSRGEYVVKISVCPTCECEDYQKFKGNKLCKHIIWVYLYQLKVDKEHCLIQQIALKTDEVKHILKIPRVKAILSKDIRNDQGRTWYLSPKEKKRGKNPCCKAFRCKKEILPGKLCLCVEGLEVVELEPPKVYQTKFYFCPQVACLRQIPLWSNIEFPTKISVKNDVSPSQIEDDYLKEICYDKPGV